MFFIHSEQYLLDEEIFKDFRRDAITAGIKNFAPLDEDVIQRNHQNALNIFKNVKNYIGTLLHKR